jgi:hypothetical protein
MKSGSDSFFTYVQVRYIRRLNCVRLGRQDEVVSPVSRDIVVKCSIVQRRTSREARIHAGSRR